MIHAVPFGMARWPAVHAVVCSKLALPSTLHSSRSEQGRAPTDNVQGWPGAVKML
jgi:hypothetical protein